MKIIEARDHPRRCGENLSQSNSGIGESGSPPQVRGKLLVTDFTPATGGITPAGAGKTREDHNVYEAL